MREPILCYIDGDWAYFTTKPLSEQWGDDWGDAPYEHNAGEPYEEQKGQIIKIVFDLYRLLRPCDSELNTRLSVEDINNKKEPWLSDTAHTGVKIWAGTTLSEFKKLIRKAGGKVYVEEPEGNGLEKLRRINNGQK